MEVGNSVVGKGVGRDVGRSDGYGEGYGDGYGDGYSVGNLVGRRVAFVGAGVGGQGLLLGATIVVYFQQPPRRFPLAAFPT